MSLNKPIQTSFSQKFKSSFIYLDIFGIPINFLHKGGSKYKSVFGATTTILYAVLILAYLFN
jgi:hypothetical protein